MKWIIWPGLASYEKALSAMEQQLDLVIGNKEPDTVFLLQHKPVYTAGTSHKPNELLNSRQFPVIYTDRGGKFTYHGPGQRVIYPLINLNNHERIKDLKLYVRTLERWIIDTLAEFKLEAFTAGGRVGIWVKNKQNMEAKIGAIGIRVKKWVTYHGIAVNISTNLEHYKGIIPCGLSHFPVTSLEDAGVKATMEEFDAMLQKNSPW